MTVRKTKNSVTFVFEGKPAKSVFVVGDFNRWDPKANKMTKSKDGSFRAKLTLNPGRYQYKYVADGTWIEDRDADKVPNPYGSANSIVEI